MSSQRLLLACFRFRVFPVVCASFRIFCMKRSNLFDILDRRMVLVGNQNYLVTVEAHVTRRASDPDCSNLSFFVVHNSRAGVSHIATNADGPISIVVVLRLELFVVG